MERYDHRKIQNKWQKKWEEENPYHFLDNEKKEKFYVLDMFPYPSSDGLHMGHTEGYSATDIFFRYKTMKGFEVLHPQGFDSFGLPAENYAIKTGTHPKETTAKNIENYIKQMKFLGLAHNIERSVSTSTPEYYKWTQWIFGKFFENDLVYKKTSKTNWCDSCKTILANEQVENGKCERCKGEVTQKEIPGWFFRITDFADELIEDLSKVDWPSHTKTNQINWIGKSEGSEIDFKIKDSDKKFTVFTTRADTLFGVTYCVLAPEHKLINELEGNIENLDEVKSYVEKATNTTDRERLESKEKTGVEIKGVKAINPVNGEEVPVWVADYVLGSYGTGAVMAVPAHDERDFEFAKKYGLEIKKVVAKKIGYINNVDLINERVYGIIKNKKDEYLIQYVSVKKTYWLPGGHKEDSEDDRETLNRELREETGYTDFNIGNLISVIYHDHLSEDKKVGKRSKFLTYEVELISEESSEVNMTDGEIQDGLINRWVSLEGALDIINTLDEERKSILKEPFSNIIGKDINIEYGILINSDKFDGLTSEEAKKKITEFVGGRIVSNYRLRDWSVSRQRYWGAPIPIVCSPEGQAHFVGEENLPWTLPEDVDFVPTGEAPLKKSQELLERTEKIFGNGWTPETDTLDTFVCSSWYYLRYPDPKNEKEFCSREKLEEWLPVDLYIGGAEHTYMHLLYARFFTKALNKIGALSFKEPFLKLRHQGMVLDKDGLKMSKSKGNVVNPNEVIEKYGADAVRLYMMFMAPFEDDKMWKEENIVGVYRFLERVWKFAFMKTGFEEWLENKNKSTDGVSKLLNKTIKKVGDDINNLQYNTAISSMMIFLNEVYKNYPSKLASGIKTEDYVHEGFLSVNDYKRFLKILAPFAPHITEEIWSRLGEKDSIHAQKWPEYDTNLLEDEDVTIVIQVNGKVRASVKVLKDSSQEKIQELALSLPEIDKWVKGNDLKKIIYINNKVLNIVI